MRIFIDRWLLLAGEFTNADETLARMRSVRPSIVIRPEVELVLRHFESDLKLRKTDPQAAAEGGVNLA
jgi:hypothetical protein